MKIEKLNLLQLEMKAVSLIFALEKNDIQHAKEKANELREAIVRERTKANEWKSLLFEMANEII